MATVNVYFGFYPKNAIKNPNIFASNPALVKYYDISGSRDVLLNLPVSHSLSAGNFIWETGATTGYTGMFYLDKSYGAATTMLLGGNDSNSYSVDIALGLNNIGETTFKIPFINTFTTHELDEPGWSVTPIVGDYAPGVPVTYGFTLDYSGVSNPEFIPYVMITTSGFPTDPMLFQCQVTSSDLFTQTICFTITGLPLPPVKFETTGLSVAVGTEVNIAEITESNYYTHGFTSNVNVTETNLLPLATGGGFGSNLEPFILREGSVETNLYNPAGMLFFVGNSEITNPDLKYIDIVFSVGGKVIKFPTLLNLSACPGWSAGTTSYQGGYSNYISILFVGTFPISFYPAFQVNIDPISSVKVDVIISVNDPSITQGIGIQGMQFATTSPIPVCLAKDCAVWTSLGLEKIQDLKSGCQLVAVDIEGNEFLAKFDIFQQTRRSDLIEICRHEPDVIVSHRHTILYPDSEIKDFKCPECEKSKPYTNQLNKQSCHHCHIFNVKNHTPILSKDFLPIEKAETTLYHVIPEDLVNVKGFKVGERRVLISEITTSEIQLLMSGFVKV